MTQNFAWYVINVYSGFEGKVVESIQELVAKKKIEHMFEDFLIPSEQVTQIKRGVKVSSEQRFFPGYIMVRMVLTDETWHLVKNIPKVSGFLGARGKPEPIPQSEVLRIQNQVVEGGIQRKAVGLFYSGDQVKVCDGPFNTFTGMVEEVDEMKERLKVTISILGRATPVELDFSQVEKI